MAVKVVRFNRVIGSATGFTLLETLLALFIFGLAMGALIQGFRDSAQLFHFQQEEGWIQQRLKTMLLEGEQELKVPGRSRTTNLSRSWDEQHVSFLLESAPLDLLNEKKQKLEGMVMLKATATWVLGSERQEESAMIYLNLSPELKK